jgi:hypothetical protein
MSATRAITLPHGVFRDHRPCREVELRTPTGADEAYLLEQASQLSPAERVSELLARCVLRVGDEAAAASRVRSLTAGDREALLLHIRQAAFGDRLGCVLECPACQERLDVEVSLGNLLVAPYPEPRERYEATLGANGSSCSVRFRLPTGADQEAAAHARDAERGAELILERCVEEVTSGDQAVECVPQELHGEFSSLLAALDPQAELSLALRCPACDAGFTAVLDTATVLFAELTATGDRLYREVHALALHYHWSEGDILALDVRRRRRYLELLSDSGDADWGLL